MARVVGLPPEQALLADGSKAGGWWHQTEPEGRIICDLCPRACSLKPGDRGFCFVRENRGGQMVLTTYGRSTGFCVDPIEKKPLNHFYPGSGVLSFGTAGCNLGCKFCQNWDISKSREIQRLSEHASPDEIAAAAQQLDCQSVAFTYNDPVIWAEYAIDVAQACHDRGIKTVAVTAGYITPQARGPFYDAMDAANVDLKAFTEEFYHRLTLSRLAPVLDTLQWLKRETDVWYEITNLVIPRANDSPDELRRMCDWILEHVGDLVPVHFSAFHPDFRMRDRPRTPPETLTAAYEIACRQGLKYVYTGNVHDAKHQSTYCHHCGQLLIQRDWYQLGVYHLKRDRCGHCGGAIPGHFQEGPGTWGPRRLPVSVRQFQSPRQGNEQSQCNPQAKGGTTMTGQTGSNPGPKSGRAAFPNVPRPELTDQQKNDIHRAACRIVAAEICRCPDSADVRLGSAGDATVMGAFVTLQRQGRLRACCGMLGRPVRLAEAVDHAARRTATEDPRLPPISPSELEFLDLSVSLLYGFRLVDQQGDRRIGAVQVGRHGLQIQRGGQSGLLLPNVATDNDWDAPTFLRQVCVKAGLPTTAWRQPDTQLITFEAAAVKGPFDPQALRDVPARPAAVVSRQDMARLADYCRQNVVAQACGATPNYYVANVPDGNVHGVFLSVLLPGGDEPLRFGQLSFRPALPLQTTLFNLSQNVAAQLRLRNVAAGDVQQLGLQLTVMFDPAMHGTVQQPDLRGIDPAERAVLVVEGSQWGWAFDPEQSAQVLLETAAQQARVTGAERAGVYSLAARSTENRATFSTAPQAQAGPAVRLAAVAGAFYPAEAHQLNEMIRELLGKEATAQPWPAALVPHAGLRYSGRIAAEVLKRIRFPEVVIIVAPKHTPLGVRWAVAPHQRWSLPGATVPSDPELARHLAESISDLQLDAAAHQREHAIEVQLPFLARLAPDLRVVGITIGSGDWDRCRQFAREFAEAIRDLTPRPLLLISSDMNHDASETDTRRLDKMAITEMKRLDPEQLYRTTTEHQISMCGMRPAVIVMQTLQMLGGLKKSKLVAYGTSADATGDKRRVVGYAGMLFA